MSSLAELDFSILQQCIHCGMCLPTCPTYDLTKHERNSPRGRIALMRAVAEGKMEVTPGFGEEMYFCLGCLACETACPAGVDYATMFEHARADIETAGVLERPVRKGVRALALGLVFTRPWLLRAVGRMLWVYQACGLEKMLRRSGFMEFLPDSLRELEPMMPRVQAHFSDGLIAAEESPLPSRYRVGMLTGCVQDLVYSQVNRDTVDVLLEYGCAVVTPESQPCCGSLHAHNGELEWAREMARRNIDMMERAAGSLETLDAIISNAAGCGAHLKHYDRLLEGDSLYRERARVWSSRVQDIHEWLVKIGPGERPGQSGDSLPLAESSRKEPVKVAYHEACHLCHGQKISRQPRQLLETVSGVEMVELDEAAWCCGSAGVYNITQPETSQKLLKRKLEKIARSGAEIVAAANPGCCLQLEAGARAAGQKLEVVHPITLLARNLRNKRMKGAPAA